MLTSDGLPPVRVRVPVNARHRARLVAHAGHAASDRRTAAPWTARARNASGGPSFRRTASGAPDALASASACHASHRRPSPDSQTRRVPPGASGWAIARRAARTASGDVSADAIDGCSPRNARRVGRHGSFGACSPSSRALTEDGDMRWSSATCRRRRPRWARRFLSRSPTVRCCRPASRPAA